MKFFNKVYTVPVIVLLLVAISACDNNLSENVYSSVTEQNFSYKNADYQSMIAAPYTEMRVGVIGGVLSNYVAQMISADAVVMPANLAGGWDDGGRYRRMHTHQWNSEQGHLSNMWQNFYQGVMHANRVIEQLNNDVITVPTSVSKESLIAEMRTVRAFYYWLILDNFGDAPLVTSANADQELPVKSTREELYNFAVTEITQSLPDLSESSDQDMYGRMNKWAAKTLLAKLYLNAEVYTGQPQWEKVITQTDDIIGSQEYSLDDNYSDIFASENSGSPEIIFAIPFDENLGGGFHLHRWAWHTVLGTKFQTEASPWGTGSARGVPQFAATYNSLDSRLDDTWIRGPQFGPDGEPLMGIFDDQGEQVNFENTMKNGVAVSEDAGYRVGKFEVPAGAQAQLNNDFPYFRYAEVLMMKAEALLRTNRAGEAATIVTQVRQRAFTDNPGEAVVTGSDLQQDSRYDYGYVENFEIVDEGNTEPIQYGRFLDELGWEFAWEAHRRRDLIRFDVFTKKSWLSHQPNGDHRTVFPIPQSVIDTNPNIEQNPNY